MRRKEDFEIDENNMKRCVRCYNKKELDEFRKYITTIGEYKILTNCIKCREMDKNRKKNKKIEKNEEEIFSN